MTTTNATTYPTSVTAAISYLRHSNVRPLYIATMLRTSYPPGGMPADVGTLYKACVKEQRSGIDAALRGMP